MADSKIEIKVGSIIFSGEGDGDWLSKQLDKVLAKIPELAAIAPPESAGNGSSNGANPAASAGTPRGQGNGTLAAYLKATNASESQPRKFLATAVWLHDTTQKSRLTVSDITGALSQHNQGKLTNPSLILARNAEKGYCVREGKQFYVVDDGRDTLK